MKSRTRHVRFSTTDAPRVHGISPTPEKLPGDRFLSQLPLVAMELISPTDPNTGFLINPSRFVTFGYKIGNVKFWSVKEI